MGSTASQLLNADGSNQGPNPNNNNSWGAGNTNNSGLYTWNDTNADNPNSSWGSGSGNTNRNSHNKTTSSSAFDRLSAELTLGDGKDLSLKSRFQPFINLPNNAIEAVWTAWFKHAQGIYLNRETFDLVYAPLQSFLQLRTEDFTKRVDELFEMYCHRPRDSGTYGSHTSSQFVDNIELIASLTVTSQCSRVAKVMRLLLCINMQGSPRVDSRQLGIGLYSILNGVALITDGKSRELSEKEALKFASLLIGEASAWIQRRNGNTRFLVGSPTRRAQSGKAGVAATDFELFCLNNFAMSKWFTRYTNLVAKDLPPSKKLASVEIVVLEGRKLKNNDVMLRQNPYVKITFGSRTRKTKHVTNGGRSPKWLPDSDNILSLPVELAAVSVPKVKVQVYNKKTDGTSDALIGEFSLDILETRKKLEQQCRQNNSSFLGADHIFGGGQVFAGSSSNALTQNATWYELKDKNGSESGELLLCFNFEEDYLSYGDVREQDGSDSDSGDESKEGLAWYNSSDVYSCEPFMDSNVPYGGRSRGTKPNHGASGGTNPGGASMSPSIQVRLKSISGYSGKQRHVVQYLASGNIVYTAGRIVVVRSIDTLEQSFFMEHTNTISALALHPGGRFVATAEHGVRGQREPSVLIWDTSSLRVVASIDRVFGNLITAMEFSPGGRYLLCAGKHGDHGISIVDWENGARLVFSYSSPNNKAVNAITFISDNRFVACIGRGVTFFNTDSKVSSATASTTTSFVHCDGQLGKFFRSASHVCAVVLAGGGRSDGSRVLVTGTQNGKLYKWDTAGRCIKVVDAHTARVTDLCSRESMILSASGDGSVKLWASDLTATHTFNPSGKAPIHSICLSPTTSTFLAGTSSASIVQVYVARKTGEVAKSSIVIADCHKKQVTALAAHPTQPNRLCTVGIDGSVKIWNYSSGHGVLEQAKPIDMPAHDCTWSPDGSCLAVGFGSREIKSGSNGVFELEDLAPQDPLGPSGLPRKLSSNSLVLLQARDLKVLRTASDANGPIVCVKFSPGGELLVSASKDGKVYIYSTLRLALMETLVLDPVSRTQAFAVSFDFSNDGQFLRTQDSAKRLAVWNYKRGQQADVKLALSAAWHTHTCTSALFVDGAVSVSELSRDITCVDAHPEDALAAVGTARGTIRLYTLDKQQVNDASAYQLIAADAAPIVHVMFQRGTSGRLWSMTGASSTACVLLWQYQRDVTADQMMTSATPALALRAGPMYPSAGLPISNTHTGSRGPRTIAPPPEIKQYSNNNGAVKQLSKSAPKGSLELEWVHGCRQAGINHIQYLAEDCVIFPASTLIVRMTSTRGRWQQAFMQGHTCAITAVSVSKPPVKLIASAEHAQGTVIYVWNAETLEAVQRIATSSIDAVVQLSFSPTDADMLLCLGIKTGRNVLLVYSWRTARLVASRSCKDAGLATSAVFTPDSSGILQCGAGFCKLWSLQGNNLTFRRIQLRSTRETSPVTFTNIAWVQHMPVLATQVGHLCVLDGTKVVETVLAHVGSIHALYGDDTGVVSAGEDGIVRIWSASLQPIRSLDMRALNSLSPQVVCISRSPSSQKILVTTRASEVFELAATDGRNFHEGPILSGHYSGSVSAMAAHPIPSKQEFATCGSEDQRVWVWHTWSRSSRRVSASFGASPTACCYSPKGDLIAVCLRSKTTAPPAVLSPRKLGSAYGTKNEINHLHEGNSTMISLLKSDTLDVVHQSKAIIGGQIVDMVFSPCGKLIALATESPCLVYIVQVNALVVRDVVQIGTDTQESKNEYECRMEFSADSKVLRAVLGDDTGGIQQVVWEVSSGEQVAPELVENKREEEQLFQWASNRANTLEDVSGVWGAAPQGITSIARGQSTGLVATGTLDGRVNLHVAPCAAEISYPLRASGHACFVSSVCFLPSNNIIVTAGGGDDRCVLQWSFQQTDQNVDGGDEFSNNNKTNSQFGGRPGSSAYRRGANWLRSGQDGNTDPARKCWAIAFQRTLEDASEQSVEENASAGQVVSSSWGATKNGNAARAHVKQLSGVLAGVSLRTTSQRGRNSGKVKVIGQLEWVHGHGVTKSVNRLHLNACGDLVYTCGESGVIMSVQKSDCMSKRMQRFHWGHTASLSCLVLDSRGVLAASGQTGEFPDILLWDAQTGRTIRRLQGGHLGSVAVLAFSPDNQKLASAENVRCYGLTVWRSFSSRWTGDADCIAVPFPGLETPTTALCWVDNQCIARLTSDTVEFWALRGHSLNMVAEFSAGKPGIGKDVKAQPFTCAVMFNGHLIVGGLHGDLFVFDGVRCSRVMRAHASCCTAICAGANYMLSGGGDGKVMVWDRSLSAVSSVDATAAVRGSSQLGSGPMHAAAESVPREYNTVFSVALDSRERVAFVELYGHGVVAVDIIGNDISGSSNSNGSVDRLGGSAGKIEPLILQGPGGAAGFAGIIGDSASGDGQVLNGERAVLQTHPQDPSLMASLDDDSYVRVWSAETQRMERCVHVDGAGGENGLSWHPDGGHLACGYSLNSEGSDAQIGAWLVLDGGTEGLYVIAKLSVAARSPEERVRCVSFAPSGQWLAVGTSAGAVHLFGMIKENTAGGSGGGGGGDGSAAAPNTSRVLVWSSVPTRTAEVQGGAALVIDWGYTTINTEVLRVGCDSGLVEKLDPASGIALAAEDPDTIKWKSWSCAFWSDGIVVDYSPALHSLALVHDDGTLHVLDAESWTSGLLNSGNRGGGGALGRGAAGSAHVPRFSIDGSRLYVPCGGGFIAQARVGDA